MKLNLHTHDLGPACKGLTGPESGTPCTLALLSGYLRQVAVKSARPSGVGTGSVAGQSTRPQLSAAQPDTAHPQPPQYSPKTLVHKCQWAGSTDGLKVWLEPTQFLTQQAWGGA